VSVRRKKTVLRAVRLVKELDDVLQEDAEAIGVSASALINRIVKKYVEWDRQAEKFGFFSIATETFESILNEIDDKKLENIATTLGSTMPESVTMFWFKKLNLDSFLRIVSLFGKYSGQFVVATDYKEGNYVVTLHHNLGKKWSIYLGSFISQFVKTALKVFAHSNVTDNLAVISFHVDSSESRD
jgi:hypothetical protein